MRFAIVNMSSDRSKLTSELLERIAFAIEIQLSRDYAPLWQAQGAPVRVFDSLVELEADDRTAPLLVFDADPHAALPLKGPDRSAPSGLFARRTGGDHDRSEPARRIGLRLRDADEALTCRVGRSRLRSMSNASSGVDAAFQRGLHLSKRLTEFVIAARLPKEHTIDFVFSWAFGWAMQAGLDVEAATKRFHAVAVASSEQLARMVKTEDVASKIVL